MRFSFANRESEVPRLTAFLQANISTGDARICIVNGSSGIGKSRLVDEAVNSAMSYLRCVRVRIKQSDFRCGESGFFLRASAIAVAESCKQEQWGPSLEAYTYRRGGLSMIRSAFGATAKKVEKLATGDSEVSLDLMSAWSKNGSTLEDLLGEPSAPALRLASDYLQKSLSHVDCVLIIENAQLIDVESLYYIHLLLDKHLSLRLIYEYTTGSSLKELQNGDNEYEKFLQMCLEHDYGVLEIKLGALDFKSLARKNFQSDDTRFIEMLRRELHTRNGNVRDLERLHEVVSKSQLDQMSSSSTTIEAALNAFTTEQKLILWIITLSRRSLDPYSISQIAMCLPASLRPLAPAEVARSLAPFVELRGGVFSIDHDSLLQRLDSAHSIRRECLAAAIAVSTYFRTLLERGDFAQYSEYEILFGLIWLSQPLNSTDLVDFAVSRLSERTRMSGRPGSLLKLVHDFVQGAGVDAIHQNTIWRLIRIIYDACWIEGAIDLAKTYRMKAPELRLCYCQALSITGRHEEAEQELNQLHSVVTTSDLSPAKRKRLALYAGLISSFVARVSGNYEDAEQRYLGLNVKDIVWPEDKCRYYRFGEVAGVSDMEDRLQTAIEIARELHSPIEVVRSAVSLSMLKAEQGLLGEAIALLNEADMFRQVSYVDSYMSANNRLVVELLSGRLSEPCYDALQNELPFVLESMDRVLITNNLMAAASLMGDVGNASKFNQHLEERLPTIVERNMLRLSYYNCARFHALHGSEEIAREYMRRAFENQISFDDAYWQARKAGAKDRVIDFRLSCDFDLPMMSNWYFGWPDFEAKPE
jgi:hypothetical protein